MPNKSKRPVVRIPQSREGIGSVVYPFIYSEEKYNGIAALNNGKAAGIDCVLGKKLNNLDQNHINGYMQC